MDITTVNRIAQAAPSSAAPAPVDHATENREVVRAVKALNRTEMFGEDNQLRFQKDPETGKMVVRVVNRETEEVVSQIPAEYVLRLSEEIHPRNE
jgi:flagellar protein FlaG